MEAAVNPAWDSLLAASKRLKDAWPTPAWKWDGRLVALECAFDKALEEKALASLGHLLPTRWTSATLAEAPAPLKTIAARTGGMRPGQLLLASETAATGVGAFGLWWPWSNGVVVTIRIGLLGVDGASAPFPELRELFGVRP